MDKPDIKNLEDIAPYVREHLLPEIIESVEVCIKCFYIDELFNDSWTFGTQLWKNSWNRFKSVSQEYDDCPFEISGKGNEYKLKIGPYTFRHHRIDDVSKLPSGAKAAKASAEKQLSLFGDVWEAPVEIDNIVLAIDADVQKGLKEVFIGELEQKNLETKKYKWGKKVPVYLADGIEASSTEIIQISNIPGPKQHAPEEQIAEVTIELDKVDIESGSEK